MNKSVSLNESYTPFEKFGSNIYKVLFKTTPNFSRGDCKIRVFLQSAAAVTFFQKKVRQRIISKFDYFKSLKSFIDTPCKK
jgi:hypothetical protein